MGKGGATPNRHERTGRENRMSMAFQSKASASHSDVAADQDRAGALLAELAAALLRVPVDEQTRGLHLRALSLKRDMMRWHVERPDESIRRSVVGEILEMQDAARDWQGTPSSRR